MFLAASLFVAVSLGFPPPVAHAAGPAIIGSVATGYTTVTNTRTITVSIAAGSYTVVTVQFQCYPTDCTDAVTDNNQSGTFTQIVLEDAAQNGGHMIADVWRAGPYSSGGHSSVTVTTSGTTPAVLSIQGAGWSGLGQFVDNTATTKGACTIGAFPAMPTVSYGNNAVLFESGTTAGGTPSAGTGYSQYGTGNTFTGAGYSIQTGGAGTTAFPMAGCSVSPAAEAGAVIDFIAPTTIVIFTTVPCTFFQLQCWAYPLMFLGMFMSFFIGTGTAFVVSEKGFIYLIFAGATFGSLVEIQMGIMTPMVPLMLIAGTIAYSFRLDRIVVSASGRGKGDEGQ